MSVYKFLPQMISAIPGRITLFQAMLVDSNGVSVTGKTFSAGDVKVLKYESPAWDVSDIDELPVEIGSTGIYLFELSTDETLPVTDSFPIGVKVEQSNGDQIYGFFSVNLNPSNADARYLNGSSLDGNNAILNLHQIVIDSYEPPNGSPGYYNDAVIIKGKTAILIEGNDAVEPAVKINNNDEGEGLLIGNKTISDLVAEAVVDGPTKLAEAISEILAYASCTTERDTETGTITYRNKNGAVLFTLTPGINGRVRAEPNIPIIMNNIFNHHFNHSN